MVDHCNHDGMMKVCRACNKLADQMKCDSFKKASSAERCYYLRFGEFCDKHFDIDDEDILELELSLDDDEDTEKDTEKSIDPDLDLLLDELDDLIQDN